MLIKSNPPPYIDFPMQASQSNISICFFVMLYLLCDTAYLNYKIIDKYLNAQG